MRPNSQVYRRARQRSSDVVRGRRDEESTLRDEIERLRAQNAQLRDELQKSEQRAAESHSSEVELLARRIAELSQDLERVQQRTAREIDEAVGAEKARQLAKLGDVVDSVQAGLQMSAEGAPTSWREGLLAIEQQLIAHLQDEGATLTGEVGEPYDPTIHEGVAMVTTPGVRPGHVAKVIRRGILTDDGHVVRTAQVYVAA